MVTQDMSRLANLFLDLKRLCATAHIEEPTLAADTVWSDQTMRY